MTAPRWPQAIPTTRHRDFHQLYQTLQPIIYASALRITKDPSLAQDAVHEAFVRMIRVWERLLALTQQQRVILAVVVVKNVAKDSLRKRKHIRQELPFEDYAQDLAAPQNDPLWLLICQEGYQHLCMHVEMLNERYKSVLHLRLLCHFSNHEIAQLMNLNVNTISKRCQRGLILLRQNILEDDYFDHLRRRYPQYQKSKKKQISRKPARKEAAVYKSSAIQSDDL